MKKTKLSFCFMLLVCQVLLGSIVFSQPVLKLPYSVGEKYQCVQGMGGSIVIILHQLSMI